MTAPVPAASSLQALAARIDAALPQTQCTRCGYPDCASYAEAIASKEAPINQCPPGGQEGIRRLASLTGLPELPLNSEHGIEAPRTIARIDETWCIGCTLCIKACPTDAILGANKRMHTVIEEHCTGCELCIPVCPVDCIELLNASGQHTGWDAWSNTQAVHARSRYQLHQSRTHRLPGKTRSAQNLGEPSSTPEPTPLSNPGTDKKSTLAAILAKAKAQRAS